MARGRDALARDLANAPAKDLTATRMAEIAVEVGRAIGTAGRSVRQGRPGEDGLRRHARRQRRQHRAAAHGQAHLQAEEAARASQATSRLVGKGIMYDSGGINLKPAQGMQLFMKMDMAGAAAVLGAMSVLRDLNCPNTVTAFLMCTDNMPSGSAHEDGRRADPSQRQDDRDPQHRRRGPPDPRRRSVARGGTEARRDHQHRHADRRDPAGARRTDDRACSPTTTASSVR